MMLQIYVTGIYHFTCHFRYGAYLEKTVIGLAPNNLHRFRARAITSIAPGKWNDWKQVRTGTADLHEDVN